MQSKNLLKIRAYSLYDKRVIKASPYEIKIAGETDVMKRALEDVFKEGFSLGGLKPILFIFIISSVIGVVVYMFINGMIPL